MGLSNKRKFIVVVSEDYDISNGEESKNVVYVVNKDSKETGSLTSLRLGLLTLEKTSWDWSKLGIFYGDTLFRRKDIDYIMQSKEDCSLLLGSLGSSTACREFVISRDDKIKQCGVIPRAFATHIYPGGVSIGQNAFQYIKEFCALHSMKFQYETVSDIINSCVLSGLTISSHNVKSDWCELETTGVVANFILGSKGETLLRLKDVLEKSYVPESHIVSLKDWRKSKSKFLGQLNIQNLQKVAVRSSSIHEDSFSGSNAGAFYSVLNVGQDEIATAIDKVFGSYPAPNEQEQVLIQRMAENVVSSGVVFTRTLGLGAPYWTLNYSLSGKTDDITSGKASSNVLTEVSYHKSNFLNNRPWKRKLHEAIHEIVEAVNHEVLDIEFAVNENNEIILLQVRPLLVPRIQNLQLEEIDLIVKHDQNIFEKIQDKSSLPLTDGPQLYSVMTDWNPAEIVGRKPSKLAVSLYGELITNEIWARQRFEFGYQDIRTLPLVTMFGGTPYVNVRASIESFIPNNFNKKEVKIVADICVNALKNKPYLHDKIEFDIIPTCYTFDYDTWVLENQKNLPVSIQQKLKIGLQAVNSFAFDNYKNFLDQVKQLDSRCLLPKTIDENRADFMRQEIATCKEFGTLPFAHLARCGFVAITLLKSAVSKSIITEGAFTDFMRSIRTVAKELSEDAYSVKMGSLSNSSFIIKYGHLRQGTYDITNDCYAVDPARYLEPIVVNSTITKKHKPKIWTAEKNFFFSACRDQLALGYSDEEIENFLISSIEGREQSKFIFTKTLSRILNNFIDLGQEISLKPDDMQHLSIHDLLLVINYNGDDINNAIFNTIKQNRRNYELQKFIELPDLLHSKADFESYEIPSNFANYIGKNKIEADITLLHETKKNLDISGKIVMIEAADPGFDWIFGHSPAGLVTMYGGANSHMAIRAAELGLPAVIGLGRKTYQEYCEYQRLIIDCENKLLIGVS
ncbi:PEP-utilizing enzyme [Planktomarina sp.]|nr:PEP-utilizing enzyme [Planktomarina sp.]